MRFIIVNKKLEEGDFTKVGRLGQIRNAFFQTYLTQHPEDTPDKYKLAKEYSEVEFNKILHVLHDKEDIKFLNMIMDDPNIIPSARTSSKEEREKYIEGLAGGLGIHGSDDAFPYDSHDRRKIRDELKDKDILHRIKRMFDAKKAGQDSHYLASTYFEPDFSHDKARLAADRAAHDQENADRMYSPPTSIFTKSGLINLRFWEEETERKAKEKELQKQKVYKIKSNVKIPGTNFSIAKINTETGNSEEIKNDLSIEGHTSMMDHCVGTNYTPNVQDGQLTIYSLRDKQNLPHVTMTYNNADRKFTECKGKSNSVPKPAYIDAIKKWLVANFKPEEYRDLENVNLGSDKEAPLHEFKFDKRLSVFRLY